MPDLLQQSLLACLMKTMAKYGIPAFIRSDNGSEFIEKGLREWLAQQGTATLYVRPGSPWENCSQSLPARAYECGCPSGYKCESFNGKFRDEFLNREIFHSLVQA